MWGENILADKLDRRLSRARAELGRVIAVQKMLETTGWKVVRAKLEDYILEFEKNIRGLAPRARKNAEEIERLSSLRAAFVEVLRLVDITAGSERDISAEIQKQQQKLKETERMVRAKRAAM